MTAIPVEYIESGTFVGSEEDCYNAEIKAGDTLYVTRHNPDIEIARLKAELKTKKDQLALAHKALEPLAALADAQDALSVAMGCDIPAIHEGDDGAVADPDDRIIPFLRKRSQPYYITMRDAVAARTALVATKGPNE